MKSAEKIYKEFVETAKYLLKELDYYGINQFKQKESENEWSIGQLYDHLIFGTQNFHVREIRNCLEKKNGATKGGKKVKGMWFFMTGSFPPFKFKGKNATNYEPAQPGNPVQIKDDLFRFIKLMNQLAKEIDKSDLSFKTENPSLGMLNALEWYKLIEMHFRHHLKQKHRLDEKVRSYKKEDLTVPKTSGSVDEDYDLLY
ncbi:MAG: DinB family protein [Cytophagaceae bacterium]